MAETPIAAMKAVAERLDGLGLDYAFLGGSVVGFLLDHPSLSPIRVGLIVADIAACTTEGRSPLVLADRTAHLDAIGAALSENITTREVTCFRLSGGTGKKERAAILSRIDEHYAAKKPFVLLATASLIGEGFDLPRLDTLFLAMPLSFKGRLVQYAGRLHRIHDGKATARIYDYLDENSALTRAMFRRRLVGYQQMGYRVELPSGQDADPDPRLDLESP
jgi:superfamily II DNA or RNA helicase